jgi:hypothetical protein
VFFVNPDAAIEFLIDKKAQLQAQARLEGRCALVMEDSQSGSDMSDDRKSMMLFDDTSGAAMSRRSPWGMEEEATPLRL